MITELLFNAVNAVIKLEKTHLGFCIYTLQSAANGFQAIG
jgi:hypothetical protein